MYYVVIPAYEPDEKLLTLLKGLQAQLSCKVILVNDGSSPESQAIFEEAQVYATVLDHPRNLGKGQALRTAFAFLKDQKATNVIVTADADGQHSIVDIDRLARAAMNLPNRLILGVRHFTKDIPLRSRFGNKLTRLLFKWQTGVAVSDTQTGLRAFSSDLLDFMLTIEGDRYEYEMNVLSQACKHYQITEVPIQTIYIDDNASSHFRPIQDGLLIYKHLFKFALASLSGFLIDYAIYALVLLGTGSLGLGLRLLLANSIARIISGICNFSINKKLVFHDKSSVTQTGTAYFFLALCLFFCDTSLLYLFHHVLGVNLYLVKIVVGFLLFLASWLVQKHLIFKERNTFSHELY